MKINKPRFWKKSIQGTHVTSIQDWKKILNSTTSTVETATFCVVTESKKIKKTKISQRKQQMKKVFWFKFHIEDTKWRKYINGNYNGESITDNDKEIKLTGNFEGGAAFSPSFFTRGTDFSISLLLSGAFTSVFVSGFAPAPAPTASAS